jgi:hypothetical protein
MTVDQLIGEAKKAR